MGQFVGILGLQGDFALHQKCLKRIGVESKIIRRPEELKSCKGLILPGGESSTFIKLLKETGLFEGIKEFAKARPVMGTCAGLITLSSNVVNNTMDTLGLINLKVERNGYGRQIDSFSDTIHIPIFPGKPEFEGIFIRAPKILSIHKGTEAIGYLNNEIVIAQNQSVLVTTFHPELTDDLRIHQYFINRCNSKN
jgi:5'-phosphate synthase pdxT subunit